MNKATRALGISVLALTIGIGSAACTVPTQNPPAAERSVSATNTPSPSATATVATPKDADGISQRNADGVASDLNVFFSSVKSETVKGLAGVAKENKTESLSIEEMHAALQTNYPESLKYVDEKKLGADKGRQLLGALGILGIMSADITAVPEGITVTGDIAKIPHSSMKIRVGEVDQPATDGSITMNYSSGRWVITDYVASKK